ncbi:tyrosine-type recombinase/integrase [Candidatus Micrarchaeota archaeon]|nr:tyrosine-type recombinase/integrase [Candidatus Micrarchaeota archaeon]
MEDLEGAFKRLEKDERILPENKAEITKFANTWLAKGVTRIRVVKLLYLTRYLAAYLEKPFKTASKDDIMELISKIEQQAYSDSTKHDFKVVLKMFYRWLLGDDEVTPKIVSWIKPRMKNGIHKLPEELLTEEEVQEMADAANNLRDKALVLSLYESGCRIGEISSMKLKNVQFDQHGAILRVTGKTGDRRVRIITSANAIRQWIGMHPYRTDSESWLWPSRATNYHKNITPHHRSFYKVLVELGEKAGIKKHIYPHLFRHSRATALANKLTEAQMKEHFGWTQSSDMASVYVHLSGRNVDDALLAIQEKKAKEHFSAPIAIPVIARAEDPQPSENELKIMLGNPEFKQFLLNKINEFKTLG